jgi:hypothetical protein
VVVTPTRRRANGIVQNMANQLVQIATGWEISFDGPSLVGEPDVGTIVIDVATTSAIVNDSSIDLSMPNVLHAWMDKQLARDRLDWADVQIACVTIAYSRSPTPFPETSYQLSSNSDHGLFIATAAVAVAGIGAKCTSSNNQPLLRILQRPEAQRSDEPPLRRGGYDKLKPVWPRSAVDQASKRELAE